MGVNMQRGKYIQEALQPKPRGKYSPNELSALANAFSGMSASAGTFGGRTPQSPGFSQALGYLDKDREDEKNAIYEQIKLAGLADEESRLNRPVDELTRKILSTGISKLPIEQQTPFELEPGMTMRDIKENPVYSSLLSQMARLKEEEAIPEVITSEGGTEIPEKGLTPYQRINLKMRKEEREERAKKEAKKEAKPSPKFAEQMTRYDTTLALLRDIKRRKPQFDTGRLSSTGSRVAGFFGVDDPEYSTFRADVDDQLAKYIKEISGAAASDRERAFLSGIQISTNDNDETFNQKLESAIKKLEQARGAALEAERRLGKNVERFVPSLVKESQFPKTIYKNGQQATVNNEQELKEAQAEGWK